MASAAGWYVGQICEDPDLDNMIEPYSRHTTYFEKQEEAQKKLDKYGGGNPDYLWEGYKSKLDEEKSS